MTELLILASSIAVYGGPGVAVKYCIDHDGHVLADAAVLLLALAVASAHLGGPR